MAKTKQGDQNGKMKDLAPFREDPDEQKLTTDQGKTNGVAAEFIKAVAQHRHWSRERQE